LLFITVTLSPPFLTESKWEKEEPRRGEKENEE